jgi:hypothetical protein
MAGSRGPLQAFGKYQPIEKVAEGGMAVLACAPLDEGVLKGNVFAEAGSLAIGVLNNSDLEYQAHLHCIPGDGDLPVSVEGGGE